MMYPRSVPLTLLALTVAAAPLAGQSDTTDRPRRPRQERAFRQLAPETILRMRERLELSEDQVARLREMRARALEERKQRFGVQAELRARLRSGELTRDALRRELAERRQAALEGSADRPRAADVLNEAQRERLQEMRRDAMRIRMRMELRHRREAGLRAGRAQRALAGRRGMRSRGIERQRPPRGPRFRPPRRPPGAP